MIMVDNIEIMKLRWQLAILLSYHIWRKESEELPNLPRQLMQRLTSFILWKSIASLPEWGNDNNDNNNNNNSNNNNNNDKNNNSK